MAHEEDPLGKALDALNVQLDELEDHMADLGLKTPAHVALPSGGLLSYKALAGSKRAGCRLVSVARDGAESALTSTGAARRLEAVDYLAALLAEAGVRQRLRV